MDPVTMATVGGLGEAAIASAGQLLTNRSNQKMSREQMAFQERMSSTALQRFRADAEKAGFNPLYYLKGGGASTPGGSMSVSQNPLEGVRGTTAKALEARVNAATVKNLEAQNAQIMSQAALNTASAGKVVADTAAIEAGLPEKVLKGSLWKEASSAVELGRRMLAGEDLQEGKYLGGLLKVRKKK